MTSRPLALLVVAVAVASVVGCSRNKQIAESPTEQAHEKWLRESLDAKKTPTLTLSYAGVLENHKQYDEARQQYETVLASESVKRGEVAATPDQLTAARLGLARINGAEGLDEAAVSGFRSILQSHPKHSVALQSFGQYQFGQGRYAEAESLLRQAVAADPKNRRAKLALATSLVKANRIDEARPLLISVMGPKDAQHALSRLLMKNGELIAAQRELAQVVQNDRGNRAAAQELATLNRQLAQQSQLEPLRPQQPASMVTGRQPAVDPALVQPLPAQRIALPAVRPAQTAQATQPQSRWETQEHWEAPGMGIQPASHSQEPAPPRRIPASWR